MLLQLQGVFIGVGDKAKIVPSSPTLFFYSYLKFCNSSMSITSLYILQYVGRLVSNCQKKSFIFLILNYNCDHIAKAH